MITRRRLLSLLLPFLAALAWMPIASSAERGRCLHGEAGGSWQLPSKQRLGQAQAVLLDGKGERFLGLRARLATRDVDGEHVVGELAGALLALGNDAHRVARVAGRWRAAQDGSGFFEAVILLPEDGVWKPIGKIRGRFHDRPGDDAAGILQADWSACPH